MPGTMHLMLNLAISFIKNQKTESECGNPLRLMLINPKNGFKCLSKKSYNFETLRSTRGVSYFVMQLYFF